MDVQIEEPIYKIMIRSQWDGACRDGVFRGAPVDLADGFIHFSASSQVRETARKHFAGQRDLVLAAFDPRDFGAALRWEVSRGGDRFPHLYAPLDPARALWVKPLPWRDAAHAEAAHDFAGLLP